METFQIFDIILLAMIAAFILFRLHAVLGRRTGNERPPHDPYSAPPGRLPASDDKVIRLPGRAAPAAEPAGARSPLDAATAQIRQVDRSFDPAEFLAGAKAAYEMIVTAYAQGDRKTLRPLLGEDVYAAFDAAITQREKAGQSVTFTYVGLKQAAITDAALRNRIAEVTVRFVSEMISATKDAAGKVIEGNAEAVREVTDIWTFARDTRASNPNWALVATGAS